MENTLENKEKFFAQYWGVRAFMFDDSDINHPFLVNRANMSGGMVKQTKLLLLPLSEITDEDALKIDGVLDGEEIATVEWGKILLEDMFSETQRNKWGVQHIVLISDYLRSKGHALPYNGISVEKQVEWGWVKLKTDKN